MLHQDEKVRILANNIFSQAVQNNTEVQQFALRCGALNLMTKFAGKTKITNDEAVSLMGALSAFLRADNFNSKQQFIGNMGGLQFLGALLLDKSSSTKMYRKTIILMHDLAINDESIFDENPTIVRKTFGQQMGILERLMELMTDKEKLEDKQYWDLREYTLRILFRVFQVCP